MLIYALQIARDYMMLDVSSQDFEMKYRYKLRKVIVEEALFEVRTILSYSLMNVDEIDKLNKTKIIDILEKKYSN